MIKYNDLSIWLQMLVVIGWTFVGFYLLGVFVGFFLVLFS